MLSKWLDAARKRLGGTFPRDAARAEMEAYAEKMRRRKLKGGKQAVAGVVEDETTEAARLEKRVVRLSQASTSLARRWLRAAQDSIQARFRERGKKLRDDCEECLGEMPEEDEWFYGADLRFEGRQVLTRGDALRADQLTLEAEAAVRVRRIEADFQVFEAEKQVRVAAPFLFWCLCFRPRSHQQPRTSRCPRSRRRDRPGRPSRGAFDAARRRRGALRRRRGPSPRSTRAGDDRRGTRRLRGQAPEARRRGESEAGAADAGARTHERSKEGGMRRRREEGARRGGRRVVGYSSEA